MVQPTERSLKLLLIVSRTLLGVLLFLLFLLLLPVHTRLRFDGKLQVWCGLGPVSFRLFPSKKPKKEKTKAAADTSHPSTEEPRRRFDLMQILEYVRLGAEALGVLRRRLVIRQLTLRLRLCGEDAAQTALLYGRTAAAVSALYPILEHNLRLKKTDLSVDADFEQSTSQIFAETVIAACPLRLLMAAAVLLIRFLKLRKEQTLPQNEKGGELYEQHQ